MKIYSNITKYSLNSQVKIETFIIIINILLLMNNQDLEIINDNNIKEAVELWITNKTEAISKYGHISDWDTSNVKNMSFLFSNKRTFNEDISNWNVSKVEDMNNMFYEAENFNQDISQWKVFNVCNMKRMFKSATLFNQNIGKWDVSKVTNM